MPPAARVLLTSLASRARLREWAQAVSGGALVGLGHEEEVRAARRECAGLDNVLFVLGHRGEIPWAEAWFDVIVDEEPGPPTAEMRRVLAPGGRVLRSLL